MTTTRRDLLRAGALGAAAGLLPAGPAAARARRPGHRRLVLLQLTGGQDALSMLVPLRDPTYRALRSQTRLAERDVLPLTDDRALHGALPRLARRFRAGHLALVEGVGIPGVSRSHFAAMDVWHAGDPQGRGAGEGWIGRTARVGWADEAHPELLVHFGTETPYSLFSTAHPAVTLTSPTAYRWLGPTPELASGQRMDGARGKEPAVDGRDAALARLRRRVSDAAESSEVVRRAALAHRPRVDYPRDVFGATLRDIAGLIHGGLSTRVFSLQLGGFDTHADQRRQHDDLMRSLDAGLGAFLDDLETTEAGAETLVLAFSEFGRRVEENASGGTDHGKGGTVLLLGAGARGGLHGAPNDLADLDDGDVRARNDLRAVYASVLRGWFDVDPAAVLGGSFAGLDLA